MRLGILSDLHLPNTGALPHPGQAADVMILAGDIGVGVQGLAWAKTVFDCPVIYVPGNHEYYYHNIATLDDALYGYAVGTNVCILQNRQWVYGGVRFVGATLWTDFALFGKAGEAALRAQDSMNDYRVIGTRERRALKPSETLACHQESLAYLQQSLNEPFAGATVVVTHHAPSLKSIAPRYRQDPLTPCFASAIDTVVESSGAAYWVHGHVHDFVSYSLGCTRVIANPKGYRGEEKERESQPFQWDFSVELFT